MLTCLIDYIGIKFCAGETSTSGQFINSLAGISIRSMDGIANEEQITYKGVWKDVQEQAAARFYSDVISELGKCFKVNKHCDYEALICDNKDKLTNAWKYLLGNQLMLERIFSERINRFTTVDRKAAEELRDFYQVEYEKALTSAMQFVDLGDCHLHVGGNPERAIYLP